MIKKRILIFSTAYLPLVGGAEVAVKEITDRIPDFEFIIVTAKLRKDLPNQEKIGNVNVHRLGRGNHWDKFRLIVKGPSYASNLGHFDLVWSIMASYAGFTTLRFKKQNPEIKYLLTLQEGDSRFEIYKHVWWCWWYFKQIFKQADKIQAISNYLAKWAKDLGAECPIEVVPNGVDIDKFQISNNKYQITNIKKQLGISENDKIIITVSRLVKKNGVGDLIKAMGFLSEDFHLLIAGEGELKEELVSLTEKLNLQKRVHFLGNVSHNELPKYLSISNVFCRPSLSEGLGNVFLEAMAAGIPVIGTKVGGIPDFLVENKTGWFCKAQNSRSIVEKINYILDVNNKEKIQKITENAKMIVEEKYSWELIANKMKNIFESI